MATQRARKPNWSSQETEVLLNELLNIGSTLFAPLSPAVTNKFKITLWNNVADKVSTVGVCRRDAIECKIRWRCVKKDVVEKTNDMRKTGGGRSAGKFIPFEDIIRQIIGENSSLFGGIDVDGCDTSVYTEAQQSQEEIVVASLPGEPHSFQTDPLQHDKHLNNCEMFVGSLDASDEWNDSIVAEGPALPRFLKDKRHAINEPTPVLPSQARASSRPGSSMQHSRPVPYSRPAPPSNGSCRAKNYVSVPSAEPVLAVPSSESVSSVVSSRSAPLRTPSTEPEALHVSSGSGNRSSSKAGIKRQFAEVRMQKNRSGTGEDLLWSEFLQSEITRNKLQVEYIKQQMQIAEESRQRDQEESRIKKEEFNMKKALFEMMMKKKNASAYASIDTLDKSGTGANSNIESEILVHWI